MNEQQRPLTLGRGGPSLFPLGLGAMGMSGMYGPADEAEGIRTIHAAMERGVTFLDTGDFYGMGHNERLVGRAIAGRRDRVFLSVKFGALRGPDGSWGGVDTRPVAMRNFLAYTLDRLGVEYVDLYRPARLDPAVPIEETVGAIAEMVKAGYVRYIGLSEVGAETIRRAHRVHPIADLQIEYSLATRGPEQAIFPALRELGISASLYGVLSRGLLSGSKPNGPEDYRGYLPRFTEANQGHNQGFVSGLLRIAQAQGLTRSQLAIAWVRAKVPEFLPVVGSRTVAQIHEALGALERPLDTQVMAEIEALGAVRGERYAPAQMAHLDSER